MGDWKEIRLGDVAAVRSGFPFRSRDWTEAGIPVVKISNVKNGRLDLSGCSHVSPATAATAEKFSLKDRDILIAMTGYIGDTALVRKSDLPAVLNQRVGIFSIAGRDLLLDRFLFYLLRAPGTKQAIEGLGYGSAQPNVSPELIHGVPILLPPLPDQRAIAEVLGALDDKIEANRGVIAPCEDLARSLVAQYQPVTTLGALATVRRKMVTPISFGLQEVEHFSLPAFDAGALPLLEQGSDIKSGKFIVTDPAVLVSKLNPHIRRVWLATPSGGRTAVTSTEFVVLTPGPDLPVEVLWAMASAPEFYGQIVELVKGTTGSHQRVASEDVLNTAVPDPQSFAPATVDSIVAAVQLAGSLRRQSSALSRMRDALLPKLLSGQVRVREAETLVGEAV